MYNAATQSQVHLSEVSDTFPKPGVDKSYEGHAPNALRNFSQSVRFRLLLPNFAYLNDVVVWLGLGWNKARFYRLLFCGFLFCHFGLQSKHHS